MRSAFAWSTEMPRFLAFATMFDCNRSVSNVPGRRKLMVTLEAATARATPAMKAVKPARAPDERSRPASGIFTEPEVMLTMRPNFLASMGSMTFWVSSTATTILAITPSIICARVSWRKSRNAGPALLFTRMSGSGQARSSAAWPSAVATSACTAVTLAPVAWRSSAAVCSSALPSRPLMITSQPASASARAQARPSPRLEAQTMALRPAIPRSMAIPVAGGAEMARNCTPPRPRAVQTFFELLATDLNRAARFDCPHLIAAPDEIAPEPAAHPDHRQQHVPKHPGERRPHGQVPSGHVRKRGLGAIPHRRERDDAAHRPSQRAEDESGGDQRPEPARQRFQRVVALERCLPQPRPAQLTRPHLGRGTVPQRLLERRIDE